MSDRAITRFEAQIALRAAWHVKQSEVTRLREERARLEQHLHEAEGEWGDLHRWLDRFDLLSNESIEAALEKATGQGFAVSGTGEAAT